MPNERIPIVVIGLLLVAVIACTGQGTSQRSLLDDNGDGSGNNQARIEMGESAQIGNLNVTITKAQATTGRDEVAKEFEVRFPAAKEDRLFFMVNVTIENVGDKREDISSRQEINLFDKERKIQQWTLLPISTGSIDGRIGPGRERHGVLVWDVHEDAAGLAMVYGDTVFTIGDASNYRPGSSENEKVTTAR